MRIRLKTSFTDPSDRVAHKTSLLRNLDLISPLDEEVMDFLEALCHDCNVERIVVFGSRAQGDYEPHSDLDLAVSCTKIDPLKWLRYKEYLTYDIRTLTKVSLVDYDANPQRLKDLIDTTGVVISDKPSKS